MEIKYVIVAFNKPGIPTFYPLDAEDIMGYFVSKAFVVSDEIKMDREGNEYHVYDVVLPYGDLRGKINTPEYNKYGNLINGTRIYEVYDSLEEAEAVRDKLNVELRNQKILCAYEKYAGTNIRRKKIEEASSTFDYYLNECEEYEMALQSLTSTLTNKSLLQKKSTN